VGSVTRDPDSGVWRVTSHGAAVQVLASPVWTTSRMVPEERHGRRRPFLSNVMLYAEPDLHRTLRSITGSVLSRDSVRSMVPAMQEIAGRNLPGSGCRTDSWDEFAERVPMELLGTLLGIDIGTCEQFAPHLNTLSAVLHGSGAVEAPASVRLALIKMVHFFMRLVKERSADPREDLVSRLLSSRLPSGEGMDPTHVVSTAILLFIAGQVTTAPVLRRVLPAPAGGSAGWDAVIEETLRLHPPQALAPRHALADTMVDGQSIERGSTILISLPDANRDAAVFSDPATFVPDRHPNSHLSFGFGRHYCLGAGVARQLVSVVLGVTRES